MQELDKLIEQLNAYAVEDRLAALEKLVALYEDGILEKPDTGDNANNHIHTIYSFSPYSPTKAAYMAWVNGLPTAGIMDHDSLAGAKEFVRAGKIIGIATTVGFECRCGMDGTPFKGRRINNPDQDSVAYLAAHGIPHQNIDAIQAWLAPYREKRSLRNRAMVGNINGLLAGSGLRLDYDEDVLPLSRDADGGSVTERHILFALAAKMTMQLGFGQPVIDFLEGLGIGVEGKNLDRLLEVDNDMYHYYLLGVLKGNMVEKFYIDATDECPDVAEFIRFVRDLGGIPAYAYLGDVGDSVTGDKKTQAFEDAYLDELVAWLEEAGFLALTYMPTRNTPQQLDRVMALCEKHNLFQICGEDINSPFQSFICEALESPRFAHLIAATWALIGHERAATQDLEDGMFSEKTVAAFPDLKDRTAHFAALAGRKML